MAYPPPPAAAAPAAFPFPYPPPPYGGVAGAAPALMAYAQSPLLPAAVAEEVRASESARANARAATSRAPFLPFVVLRVCVCVCFPFCSCLRERADSPDPIRSTGSCHAARPFSLSVSFHRAAQPGYLPRPAAPSS